MTWVVTVEAGNGYVKRIELDDDWHDRGPGDEPLKAVDVIAQFTRLMSEEHARWGLTASLGFRPPLTITVEEL